MSRAPLCVRVGMDEVVGERCISVGGVGVGEMWICVGVCGAVLGLGWVLRRVLGRKVSLDIVVNGEHGVRVCEIIPSTLRLYRATHAPTSTQSYRGYCCL